MAVVAAVVKVELVELVVAEVTQDWFILVGHIIVLMTVLVIQRMVVVHIALALMVLELVAVMLVETTLGSTIVGLNVLIACALKQFQLAAVQVVLEAMAA